MKKALVIEPADIKGILAEHFHVKPEDVIKSQYSYTVIVGEDEKEKSDCDDGMCAIDFEAIRSGKVE